MFTSHYKRCLITIKRTSNENNFINFNTSNMESTIDPIAVAIGVVFFAYVSYVIKSTIKKLKTLNENTDKLIAIEKAQELINQEKKRINGNS